MISPRSFAVALFAASVLASAPVAQTAQAQNTPAKRAATLATSPINIDADGVALHGYDPVAYFTTGTPTQGRREYAATHVGATYHFASADHRATFLADPDRYAPQYGGYCAMGVTGGAKFDIDPTAWRVENGKLYLNKDPRTQRVWLRDVPGNIVKADAKWPTVRTTTRK
jgi:YHS domain-containing protein